MIETSSRIIDIENLSIENEKHDIRIEESKRSTISTILSVDKDTPMELVISVLDKQKSINNRDIYLVGKSQSQNKKPEVCYLLLGNHNNFESQGSVQDWLDRSE